MNRKEKNLVVFKKKLRFYEYADNTIKNYSYHVGLFLEYTDKPLSHIAKKDAYKFLDECSDVHWITKNQIISSIKLFYKYVLETDLSAIKTERPRKKKQLPRVIDHSVLESKFIKIKNLKHRAMIEIGYRCGLRVSEVCELKVSDIDSAKMQILIRNSKGAKDGYVSVSKSMLRLLRAYWKVYKPIDYLFEGQNGKYSTSSCQKIYKKYIDNGSWHKLRHSYATTLLERNVNLKTIQESLRHKSSKTTEIYLHVSNRALQEAAL